MPLPTRNYDLRVFLLRLLSIQNSRISRYYKHERAESKKSGEPKLLAGLGEEIALAAKLVECLFKVGGSMEGIIERPGQKESEPSDFTPEEMEKAMEAARMLSRK